MSGSHAKRDDGAKQVAVRRTVFIDQILATGRAAGCRREAEVAPRATIKIAMGEGVT